MKSVNSNSGKGHPLVWLGLFVLVVVALAAGWYARSLMNRPAPAGTTAAVRAKIPLPPPVATPQETERMTEPTQAQPKTEAGAASGEAAPDMDAAVEPAAVTPVAHLPDPPAQDEASQTPATVPSETPKMAVPQTSAEAPSQAEERSEGEVEIPSAVPARQQSAEAPSPPDAAPQASGVETDKPFTIQAGAFRTKAYADQLMNDLNNKGYNSFVSVTTDAQQRTLYLVRVGRFETRQVALGFLEAFKAKENMAAIVTLAGPR